MVTFDDLMKTYFRMRTNKRSSPDSVEFELHWQRNLIQLRSDINNHTLRPTAYTFIAPSPRPREVWACCMALRICHHYLDEHMRPLIEKQLTPRTYNNRKNMGLNAAIRQLITDIYAKTEGYTKDAWLITWDLSGYFPNVNQDIAYRQLENILLQHYRGEKLDDLIYLLRSSVYSYPTLHCEILSSAEERKLIKPEKSLFNKPLGIGGAIGHLLWQNAMNLYTSDIDRWLQQECGLMHIRFVDDNLCVTDNKEAFLAYIMPELRKRYAEYSCTINPKKFYCQHYTKGVTFCGQTIKMQRLYTSRRIERRFRARITKHNRHVKENKIPTVISSINSYLGICKNCNGYALAMR